MYVCMYVRVCVMMMMMMMMMMTCQIMRNTLVSFQDNAKERRSKWMFLITRGTICTYACMHVHVCMFVCVCVCDDDDDDDDVSNI